MSKQNPLAALVPPESDLSRLPVDFYPGPTPLYGVVLLLAGVLGPVLVGGSLGLISLISDLPGRIVLLFALLPLLALPWGWWVIRARTIVRVGADRVEYLRVTPLGRRRWDAPLSDYAAIAYRKLLPPSSSQAGEIRHGVDLIHARGGEALRLVTASDEDRARSVQVRLAGLTGLKTAELDPTRG